MLKWIEIDLSAVSHNLDQVRKRLSPGVRLAAVVKADAYGHGAERIARLLRARGVKTLGVLDVSEAAALRLSGDRGEILLLAPPLAEEAEDVVRLRLTPTIDGLDAAAALNRAARSAGAPVKVHLDLDFGLGRWGLAPSRLEETLKALKAFRRVSLAGLSTHLDYVSGKNAVEAEEKLRTFGRAAARARRRRPGLIVHAANSSILLDFPHWQLDQVRVGNLLYGINPTSQALALRNPWQFYARIIGLRSIAKGKAIGYGSEYMAPRRMTVATLPAGYADGLTMEPADRLIRLGGTFEYWGLLRGHQVPFIGRCGIAHVLVDVSAVPNARLGEVVSLPIRRTAASARLPRVYKTED